MKIETKFELEQVVWFINYKCSDHNFIEYFVERGIIRRIYVEICSLNGKIFQKVKYKILPLNERGTPLWQDVAEERVFKTECAANEKRISLG